MRLVDLILEGNVIEAKKCFDILMSEKIQQKLEEERKEVVDSFFDGEDLVEAVKRRNPNIIRMGRVQKIRRRIRRNAKGKIVVQKNVRRSGIKGYRVSGNTVKRIPAIERLRKARLLKRSWKTTRRAKLRRTLLKRKMSMRRRSSMGLR
jgi:hypothetical protein